MMYEITGIIESIKDKVAVTDKFTKRELWLKLPDDNPKHEQTICLEFVNKECDRLDDFMAAQEVTVRFSLRGRIWKDKCFTSLGAFNINPVVVKLLSGKEPVPVKQGEMTNWQTTITTFSNDDLPF